MSASERQDVKKSQPVRAGFEDGVGRTRSQGIRAATRSSKRQRYTLKINKENSVSSGDPTKEGRPADTLILPKFGRLTPSAVRE